MKKHFLSSGIVHGLFIIAICAGLWKTKKFIEVQEKVFVEDLKKQQEELAKKEKEEVEELIEEQLKDSIIL